MELNEIRREKRDLERKIEHLMEKFCQETNISIDKIDGSCFVHSNNTTSTIIGINLGEI